MPINEFEVCSYKSIHCFSVKMIYVTEAVGEENVLTLPGCEAYTASIGACPLEKWSELTQQVAPDMETWHAECWDIYSYEYSIFDAIFVIFLCVLVLASFYYIYILKSTRNYNANGYEKI